MATDDVSGATSDGALQSGGGDCYLAGRGQMWRWRCMAAVLWMAGWHEGIVVGGCTITRLDSVPCGLDCCHTHKVQHRRRFSLLELLLLVSSRGIAVDETHRGSPLEVTCCVNSCAVGQDADARSDPK